jgi:hypothetical protein
LIDLAVLKEIDLAGFLTRHYGIRTNGNGSALCPFHDDSIPSLSITMKNGVGLFMCHGCGVSGSILDFVMKKESLDLSAAARRIAELEGIGDRPASAKKPEQKIEKIYDYTDADGKLVFQKIRYLPKAFACRRPEGQAWTWNTRGVKAVPYRLPAWKDEPRVFLCEGEKDADRLAGLGYPSTSSPWGAGNWPAELNPYFRGKEVFAVYDVGNEGKVRKIAAELHGFASKIIILTVPLDRREADVSDFLGQYKTPEDEKAAFEEIIFHGVKFDPATIKPKERVPDVILVERDAQAVKVKPITYVWHGVVPTHMSTAITGDAGEGKSLVVVDIAARITRGIPFPTYDEAGPPVIGHVFYVTSEGVPEMILVPRLIAAGADLSKVTIIEGVRHRSAGLSVLDVTTHLPMIAARAKAFPDLKLVIIDPIASFIPERINPNQTNTVRQMMDRISDLAYKLGIGSLTVMHFAKACGNVKAGQRTAGSVQFGAAVKMSWSVVRREGDPRNVRLLVPQKSNITGGYKSISFQIQETAFPAPDDPRQTIKTVRIKYDDLVDTDPELLISPPIENDNHVAEAVRFLRRKLAVGGTLYAKPLIDEAEESGVPKWALYKAKDRLGVEHDKEATFQGRTFWYLKRGGGYEHLFPKA